MFRVGAVCAGVLVSASTFTGQPPPPILANVAVHASHPNQSAISFAAVTPQYNFSYGPDPAQPPLPSGGLWNYYMPLQVNSSTPGWTTGIYSIQGLPDTFYYQPAFTTGGQIAGGCSWNQSYDSPPAWTFDGGAVTGNQYKPLSGPILRSDSVVASVYQSAPQQVAGSGIPLYGFGVTAMWDPHSYTTSPFLIGSMYFASNSCYAGDVEYGFAHYNYFGPPVDQFYFSTFSNCAAPSGVADTYGCVITSAGKHTGVGQCQAAVNLPPLQPNSAGNDWYFWYAYVSQNPANGHYVLTAGLQDPYTSDAVWTCVGDPLASPVFPPSTCPQTESVDYTCPAGQTYGAPFPTQKLLGTLGSVTVGLTNISNTPPSGRANPMLEMSQMYVAVP